MNFGDCGPTGSLWGFIDRGCDTHYQGRRAMNRTTTAMMLLTLTTTGSDARAEERPAPTKNVVYKKTKQAELEAIVHYPPGWKKQDRRPAIVFFFGGGWTKGTIEQFQRQAEYFAKRGLVTVRADYRVKSRHGVAPNDCVEDAKSAVRWIRKNAGELGVDPERIVAAGGSAGGHLAACTALTKGLEAKEEDAAVSSKPNALVLYNPALCFVGVPQLMERVGGDEALARNISPTEHVTKDAPPALVLFGSNDRLLAQGKDYLKRAEKVGAKAELYLAEGQGHGFFNRQPWTDRTTKRVDEFLTSIGYLPAKDKGSASAK
jgi:acetyl esterase/lipase